VVVAARPLLKHLNLIGGGGKRERRPTDEELFAMRPGEIGRLHWSDIDAHKRLILVRDRKDPRRNCLALPLTLTTVPDR
jgi:integrase